MEALSRQAFHDSYFDLEMVGSYKYINDLGCTVQDL